MSEKVILLIEDDEDLIQLLSLHFIYEGYKTELARDGEAAIEILQEKQVDIIICDLLMPQLDGLKFLGWLRNDAKITLPIFIITSMHEPGLLKKVLKAGAIDLFHKPIDIDLLIQKIRELKP